MRLMHEKNGNYRRRNKTYAWESRIDLRWMRKDKDGGTMKYLILVLAMFAVITYSFNDLLSCQPGWLECPKYTASIKKNIVRVDTNDGFIEGNMKTGKILMKTNHMQKFDGAFHLTGDGYCFNFNDFRGQGICVE